MASLASLSLASPSDYAAQRELLTYISKNKIKRPDLVASVGANLLSNFKGKICFMHA
jgi:hypothetical protein